MVGPNSVRPLATTDWPTFHQPRICGANGKSREKGRRRRGERRQRAGHDEHRIRHAANLRDCRDVRALPETCRMPPERHPVSRCHVNPAAFLLSPTIDDDEPVRLANTHGGDRCPGIA
jgi:hypothetical protein